MRRCEICKRPIEPERAEAIGDTRLCLQHARQIARFGGEFILTATQERTSNAGSLNRNYGGVATVKVRNQEAIDRLRDECERARNQ
jgi:hypothetical protein